MRTAIAIAALALTWAAPALADTTLSRFFHETCLATNAEVASMVAVAEAGGWREMPGGPLGARGWEAPPVGGAVRRVAVWQEEVGGRQYRRCMVLSSGAAAETIEAVRAELQLPDAEWRPGRANERVAEWFFEREGRTDFMQVREVSGAPPHTSLSLGILIQ